jgi:hypothetical protein
MRVNNSSSSDTASDDETGSQPIVPEVVIVSRVLVRIPTREAVAS